MSEADNLGSKDIWEAVMNDPQKRALILQLISKEKKGFRAATKRHAELQTQSASKLRTPHCESPSALLRRRELAKLHNRNTSDSSSSEQSEVAESLGPKLPFDQLLSGVVAFIEVRRKGVDRSAGIRAIMRCMGATIAETLCRGVTHVVFKDGTITTYQKAKLLKCHLVSILWLEAVRKHSVRVPEKNFPAFGGDDTDNVSILCSQMQKDYNDVLKDEKRRSAAIFQRSTKISDNISRRKTLSSTTCTFTSSSSFQTASSHSSPTRTNQKLASINPNQTTSFTQLSSPEVTSDDEEGEYESDCCMINGHSSSRLKKELKSIDRTRDFSSTSEATEKSVQSSEDNSKSLIPHAKGRRETINNTVDMVLTPQSNVSEPLWNKSFEQLLSKTLTTSKKNVDSDKSTNISDESVLRRLRQSSPMSSLKLSSDMHGLQTRPDDNVKNMFSLGSGNESNILIPENSSRSTNISGITQNKLGSVQSSSISSFRLSPESSITSDKENHSVNSGAKEMVSGGRRSRRFAAKETPNNTFAVPKPVETGERQRGKRASSVALDVKGRKQKTPVDKGATADSIPTVSKIDNQIKTPKTAGSKKKILQVAQTEEVNVEETEYRNSGSSLLKHRGDETRNSLESSSKNKSKVSSASSEISIGETTRTSSSSPKKRGVRRNLSFGSSTISNSSLEKSVNNAVKALELSSPEEQQNQPSGKKMRKLYNPRDYSPRRLTTDEMERKRVMRKKKAECAKIGSVNPKSIMIIPEINRKSPTKNVTPDEVIKSQNKSNKKLTKETKRKRHQSSSESKESFNSADDEQKELLEEIKKDQLIKSQKLPSQIRRSSRISTSQKQIMYRVPSSITSNDSLPISPIVNRRSTLEFQSLPSTQKKKKVKIEAPTIVCTKLHRHQVIEFKNIVRKLGVFRPEDSVSRRTTHLVAGESKRTINMLKAIAQGCWILKIDWLLESSKTGKWLPEEDFEITEFSPTVQQCRLERQAFGRDYTMDIFKNWGYIYIAKKTTPKQSELMELVELCKGKITNSSRNATVVVGEHLTNEDVTCVDTMWILDSITANKCMPLRKYLLTSSESPCF